MLDLVTNGPTKKRVSALQVQELYEYLKSWRRERDVSPAQAGPFRPPGVNPIRLLRLFGKVIAEYRDPELGANMRQAIQNAFVKVGLVKPAYPGAEYRLFRVDRSAATGLLEPMKPVPGDGSFRFIDAVAGYDLHVPSDDEE